MNSAENTRHAWYRSTLSIALLGSILVWAPQPPLSLSWLAWVAPIPWLLLVRAPALPGNRNYGSLYLAGFVFWMLAIHWLRLPHPATSLGWIALSAYLAFYLPVFVGLSRVAVHQLRAPLWLAAPVVWTGLELARAHLLTGFLMGSLAHTQAHWPMVIQISDLVGEYGVDFLMVLVAAGLTSAVFPPRRPAALLPAALLLPLALGYGYFRLNDAGLIELAADSSPPGPRIALVQGNSLAEWKADPSRERQIMEEYIALSERAVAMAEQEDAGRPLNLIVWPETMFRSSIVTFADDYQLPSEVGQTKNEIAAYGPSDLSALVRRLQTPVLVGIDRAHFPTQAADSNDGLRPLRYNSAALVGRDGKIVGTYDKIHRVMFGEYIPFADWMPFLYGFTPLTGGIQAGAAPAALTLDGTTYAPNICYETAIPHVIRRQVAQLNAAGTPPDVLVNLTNDAWYWGSSELDMHLACDVFRAVETRKPLVVAANGGISAWIDRWGRIRAASPRQQTDVIIADLDNPDNGTMRSLYVDFGDWFAGACLVCCIALAVIGWRTRATRQPPAPNP